MDTTDAFALADLDAVGQGQLVASGELTATELLDAAILRLEATRHLNAVIADLFDRGREQAATLTASGPLAGVPFLLKDLGASLVGAPEAMGSRALRTHVAADSAWIVDRYLAAGLVVFGKTNTPEWGNHCTTEPSLFGPTVNPRSVEDPTVPTVASPVLPIHPSVPPSITRLDGSALAAPMPDGVPALFKLSICQMPPSNCSGPVARSLLATDFWMPDPFMMIVPLPWMPKPPAEYHDATVDGSV